MFLRFSPMYSCTEGSVHTPSIASFLRGGEGAGGVCGGESIGSSREGFFVSLKGEMK